MKSEDTPFMIDLAQDTFTSLMMDEHLNEWTYEKDQVLINFITKNSQCLNDSKVSVYCNEINSTSYRFSYCSNNFYEYWLKQIFQKLLDEKPQFFPNQTIHSLRLRTDTLANVENFIHLMVLCGGKNVKTEDEKTNFINRVDILRKKMKYVVKQEHS